MKEITILQEQMKHINDKLDYITKEIPTREEMKRSNLELLNTALEEADKRYASKQTEDDVRRLVWGFIGIVFAVLGAMIIA